MATDASILTKSEFAARHGRDPSVVSKWIARGLLSGAGLTADGRINVAEAERQLAARLDHSRSIGKLVAARIAQPAPVVRPAAAAALSEMEQLKLDGERRKARREIEEEEARRGRYVLADASDREQRREMMQFIGMIEQRLPDLVARLGGGKAEIVMARQWFRSLRQEEALAAKARAAAAPEFDIDRPSGWPSVSAPEAAHAV